MADLARAIQNIWSSDYVQKNPAKAYKASYGPEYAAVATYLNGGARPDPANYSKLGKGLVEAEDVRRGSVTPPDPGPGPSPVPTGSLFASPFGKDSNPGTEGSPFLSFDKLSHSLSPGQTGILRGGNYAPAFKWSTGEEHNGSIGAPGTAAAPCTLTNYPGEKATLLGSWQFDGSFTTLRNVYVDPTNASANLPDKCGYAAQVVTIAGQNLTIENCDIFYSGNPAYQTKLKASGLYVYNTPRRLVIRRNRIHDFGGCYAYDHGVYLGGGDGAEIYQNWIWNGLYGWGFQVYPNPTNSKIYSNVVYNCGGGFVIAGEGSPSCHDNDVYSNVIASCPGMHTQSGAFIPGAGLSGVGTPGPNNKFRNNLVSGCQYILEPHTTMPADTSGNVGPNVDPMFVDAPGHNFLLKPGSPAASYGLPLTRPGPSV